MKKIFLILALTILFFNKGYAASGEGPATEYLVTVKKVELCEDSACATSTTVGEKDMNMDIASVSAGADIGTYAETTGLPLGTTFSHLRVTVARSFTVTGTVAISSTTCATDGGTDNIATNLLDAGTGTATSTSMYLVNAATYDASDGSTGGSDITMSYSSPTYALSMTVTGDSAVMIYKLTTPYTVSMQSPTVDISFGTLEAIGASDVGARCLMIAFEPVCTVSIK